jgi:filamentous hemagglutinin family protein
MKAFNQFNLLRKLIFLLSFLASLKYIWLNDLANAQLSPDNSLGSESSTVTPSVINNLPVNVVNGGAIRGANLFHSFQLFNVAEDHGVYFGNPQGIQNIIGRVIGVNSSSIMGTLGVLGNANLFIINPNGIIFGSNSSLDLRGSFVATTANAIEFKNQGLFDTFKPDTPPLLTVNPSGFLFSQINAAPIINRSKVFSGTRVNQDPANPAPTVNLLGLRVPDGRSLLMLGGDVITDDGGLYALGGQVDIGSVSGTGLVGLSFNGDTLSLTIPSNILRGNVSSLQAARVDTSGDAAGGGNIQVIGKNIRIQDGSQIISATTGQSNGGAVSFDATDAIEFSGFSLGGGTVSTATFGSGKAGDIKIKTGVLNVKEGANIVSSTLGDGDGGDINVYASKSVELKGKLSGEGAFGGLFSTTFAGGNGGGIEINTQGDLLIRDGASITAGAGFIDEMPATGRSGNIKISANNSFRLDGGFLLAIHPIGNAGNIDISTNHLEILNSFVGVSSSLGQAGNLTINAGSLNLNGGVLSAETGVSGANITVTTSDLLRIENGSLITAEATGTADGGNVTINAPILLALPPTDPNGSDIVANAVAGTGGNITINAQGVFGIEERKAIDGNQSNDIDASSQFGRSGRVEINTANDPSKSLVELPVTVVDPNSLVAQNPCKRGSESEFTRSGRGGLPPSLSQDFDSDATQVGLVAPVQTSTADRQQTKASESKTVSLASVSTPIVPAQGWVFNDKGEVVLVADNSAIAPQRLKANPAGCPVR